MSAILECATKQERTMTKKHAIACVIALLASASTMQINTASAIENNSIDIHHKHTRHMKNEANESVTTNNIGHNKHAVDNTLNSNQLSNTNDNVLNVASNYIGLKSSTNRFELMDLFRGEFLRNIDPTRIPWCAAFVNAILKKSGTDSTHSLDANSFMTWGHTTNSPKTGDIVLLRFGRHTGIDHVGFYLDTVVVDGEHYIRVVGGNQSHQVQVSYFRPTQVVSYRTAS